MCLERLRRGIFLASVFKQWSDVAFVIDFDGLLGRGRMIAGWGRLQDQAINRSKDEQLSDEGGHLVYSNARVNIRVDKAMA